MQRSFVAADVGECDVPLVAMFADLCRGGIRYRVFRGLAEKEKRSREEFVQKQFSFSSRPDFLSYFF